VVRKSLPADIIYLFGLAALLTELPRRIVESETHIQEREQRLARPERKSGFRTYGGDESYHNT